MKTYQNYINGQWMLSQSGMLMNVINPSSEEVIAQVPKSNEIDVDKAVKSARKSFTKWRELSVEERVHYIDLVRKGLEKYQEELAQIITEELGTPISFSRSGQVGLAITEIKATLEEVRKYSFEEIVDGSIVIKEPFGVVACITPWNYPLNQIQRKITPALLAGNTVVVKPASDTPLTALKLAEIIDEAGLPEGVFNVITGSGATAGDYLAGHPDVDVISFTGSTVVGSNLYKKAAPTIKKLVLELGGKSAMIYLEGGDMNYAIRKSMDTILNNQGQTCSAMSRLLIPNELMEEAKQYIKEYYHERLIIGDPTNENTIIGPMVSENQKKRVLEYIEKGKDEGAHILLGGNIVNRKGAYVEPTIFVDVDNSMTIAQEEIFGPVLCVIGYNSVEEAIQIANDSPYGLSGGIVGPKEKAIEVARKIQTGNIFINEGPRTAKAPFGGFKQSGIGRENGIYGLEDYLELKALFV